MPKREDVVTVLKKVEPALSTKDMIPVFTCFCFDDKTITAYDDVVALQHPLSLGIKGAIKGKVMLDFMNASKATELEVTADGDNVLLKLGRSKLEIPMLPPDDFLFKFPTDKKATTIDLPDASFAVSLQRAMVSMGMDPTHPWRLGVTVAFDEKLVTFYSSDNKGATRVDVKLKTGMKDSTVILPPRFCELFTGISREDKPKSLTVAKEWVEAKFESGLRLFSKTIQGADLKTFDELFAQTADDKSVQKNAIPIPSGLERCLDRALVLTPYAKDPFTTLIVKDGKLLLKTKSPAGHADDRITVEEHPEAEAKVFPELLKRSLGSAEKFVIAPDLNCIVLSAPGFVHLVSLIQEGEQAKEPDVD